MSLIFFIGFDAIKSGLAMCECRLFRSGSFAYMDVGKGR